MCVDGHVSKEEPILQVPTEQSMDPTSLCQVPWQAQEAQGIMEGRGGTWAEPEGSAAHTQ